MASHYCTILLIKDLTSDVVKTTRPTQTRSRMTQSHTTHSTLLIVNTVMIWLMRHVVGALRYSTNTLPPITPSYPRLLSTCLDLSV